MTMIITPFDQWKSSVDLRGVLKKDPFGEVRAQPSGWSFGGQAGELMT